MFRIALIVTVVIIAGVVSFFLFVKDYNSPGEVATPAGETDPFAFPVTEDAPPSSYGEVEYFAATPEGYEVVDVPAPGLVTSIVTSNPSDEFADVTSEIYLENFWVSECIGPSGTGRAVTLTAQEAAYPSTVGTAVAEASIADWEPYIARDMGKTLYPSLSQSILNDTNLSFSTYDSQSRVARFVASGDERTIYSGWVLNFVVFATSHDCLISVINYTYSPWAH